ncbi:thiamine pyrophosphate-dependent enzyme [Streptomyces fulvoviolaceus]|uniref:thiamine pyrophosphate-dependent enzyme n=1 Tax=Streptomyces fulvoviolaceus TaxID=285535 RepID=UPI0004CBDA71|nr:thiamine pyrophosphate-dependent enzyme [Streptomyces fulvoviolaceus]
MTSETTASCPKGAEVLVDTLVSHGVDTVFGVPGDTGVILALPITFVVLDNTSTGWIKTLQHLYLEQRCFGVDPGPVDAVLLATGMGIPGARATTLDQLELLVEGSMDHDGPAVIHVPVPEQKDASPPVAPWPAALAGRTTTRPVH